MSIIDAGEQRLVKQLVAHATIEALDKRILGSLSRCRVMSLDSGPLTLKVQTKVNV